MPSLPIHAAEDATGSTRAERPRTWWMGLGLATLSALLLGGFWAGFAAFAEHGLDFGYATMVIAALLIGLAALVHLGATTFAVLALVLRARPTWWAILVAGANAVSLVAVRSL